MRWRAVPEPVARFIATDHFPLALAEAGKADFLLTGDKSGLLVLGSHKSTRIISARAFAALFAADTP